ncbi:putative inactive purple acid phosphatase 16-like protein 1 [Colletotrichum chlorophyti]|uniref:Putative inactive purple acid phosphatase 16-like protein 1 n=1 Tax=Colletotrichum chlorophyti TaxID=708187 RepID=A0A1Q8RFF8_9PEZI|nr:putative inactive purple acid phosphatase 16-like protein 1 [Colletotrichum chlorophyti]
MASEIPESKLEQAIQPRPLQSFLRLLERICLFIFVCGMTFASMFLLFTKISPGKWPLREPSVSKPVLKLSGRDFTLAIFSDLHFGEQEFGWGIDQDINSTRVMRTVLNSEHPDLVVLNGDLITGEDTHKENSTKYIDQIVQPLVTANQKWASIYGNHDSKYNLDREQLFRAEKGYDLCYTTSMGDNLPGITNYYVPIFDGDAKDPIALLWFFDSRGGTSYQTDSDNMDDIPNWVAPETAEWFQHTYQELNEKHGRVIPSVAFVHIPPRVFLEAQNSNLDPAKFPGLNADAPLAIQGQGQEDSPFVEALLESEGLHSVYVGHDHGDSWCSTWPGHEAGLGAEAPFLCFAKHTGYGGYGTWNRGARVIKLSFADGGGGDSVMSVESWVRMENKDIVTRVSLNETYGLDIYPTNNGE